MFKTCLEFWSHFTKELYNAEAAFKTTAYSTYGGSAGTAGSAFGGVQGSSLRGGKQALFEGILHNLRILMIDNMAKPEVHIVCLIPHCLFCLQQARVFFPALAGSYQPISCSSKSFVSCPFCVSQEVIIVEDDNGEIVREQTKDTEVIAQYKTMRETIVYLTNLNYEDTEAIMLEKLDLQVRKWAVLMRLFVSCLFSLYVCLQTLCVHYFCVSDCSQLITSLSRNFGHSISFLLFPFIH